MSYGHGIAVSLLQVARAYTIFTNEGQLLPLSLLSAATPSRSASRSSARTTAQDHHA